MNKHNVSAVSFSFTALESLIFLVYFVISSFTSTNTSFFHKQRFFSTQSQCCLTFSWIELQVLLWCCLIHITIIILRHILYLVYLCPCLRLGLFMPYLWSTFHFQLNFHYIESYNLIETDKIVFCIFFRMSSITFGMIMWMKKEWFSNSKCSASGCCLDFTWIFDNFSLVLLIKVLLINKGM